MRIQPGTISLLAFTMTAFAQGRDPASDPACTAASLLSAMRDSCRPLLLFAQSINDPRFVRQIDELHAHVADIKERDIFVIPVIANQPGRSKLPADLPVAALTESEATALINRFDVRSEPFQIILLGKDGSSKLSSMVPVSVHQLIRLIDSMPMRKQEIKQKSQQGKPE